MLILLSLLFVACTQNDTDVDETAEDDSVEATNNEESTEEATLELDKEQAKEVLAEYEKTFMSVIENIEDDGSLSDFHSKAELKEDFMNIMTEELADAFVTHYFDEDNDRLYVIPTEMPEWLDQEKDFTLEQVDELEYEVTQEQSNDLIGKVRMIYVITSSDDAWIVQEVRSEAMNEETNDSGQDEESSSANNTNSNETESTEITDSIAEDLVRDHLQITENSDIQVVADHTNDNNDFVVQVYELVSNGETSHTATLGWYIVNKDNGTVEEMQ